MTGRTWTITEVDSPGTRHHFTLTPARATAWGMADLTRDEQDGLFSALRSVVDAYELTAYALAVAEQSPFAVHVVVGDGSGTVLFDIATGAVTPKRRTA